MALLSTLYRIARLASKLPGPVKLSMLAATGYLAYKAIRFFAGERETEELKRPPRDEPYYIASKSSTKFHRSICRWAEGISPENRITFKTREDALKAGYLPSSECNP